MRQPLTESTSLTEASTGADTRSGDLAIQVITPGWGSSGYYSRQVCEAAAPLVRAGTHMYLDHPSETDRHDRPERSVRDIAAVITEDARWDSGRGAVVAKAKVLAPFRELLTTPELVENIGLSITGSATDVAEGEAEGRRGPVIAGLAAINSVDFVTRAGRGGRVLEVLESARFVAEATADDRARQLSDAVRSTHGGPSTYAWVTDHDADRRVVWFTVTTDGPDPSRTYEQTYDVAANDAEVTLTGTRTEVRRLTQYVPVTTSPDSSTSAFEAVSLDAVFSRLLEATPLDLQTPVGLGVVRWINESATKAGLSLNDPVTLNPAGRTITLEVAKETTMGNIQVDEAEHRRVTEAAGRVPTLEERATTAEQRAERAERALAESNARTAATTAARTRVTTANATLPAATVDRIVEAATRTIPLTDAGQLDEAALNTAVDQARTVEETYLAGITQTTGGGVHGFGASTAPVTEGTTAPTTSAWGRPLTSVKGA